MATVEEAMVMDITKGKDEDQGVVQINFELSKATSNTEESSVMLIRGSSI